MTSDGNSAISIVSLSRSSAHMPRVTLRTVEPAKLLACQSVEKRCTRWNASAAMSAIIFSVRSMMRHEGDMPQHDRAERKRDQRRECSDGRIPGDRVGGRAAGDRVDQPAGIERRQHVGQRRKQHGTMMTARRTGWRRQCSQVKPRTLRNAPPRRSIRKRAMMMFGVRADAILEENQENAAPKPDVWE